MDESPKSKRSPLQPCRITRHIQPLGMRVLVRVVREDPVHESGLFLPEGAKEKMQETLFGEVIEVARGRPDDDGEDANLGANISGIPCGAKVLFPKSEGLPIPWDGSLRLLDVKHVLATVEEVGIDQKH